MNNNVDRPKLNNFIKYKNYAKIVKQEEFNFINQLDEAIY